LLEETSRELSAAICYSNVPSVSLPTVKCKTHASSAASATKSLKARSKYSSTSLLGVLAISQEALFFHQQL